MSEDNWPEKLKSAFDELAAIDQRKKQTLTDFAHFYEFIAEPAFEVLADELRKHKVKARFSRVRGRSAQFIMNFPGSRIDSFHYELILPKNSVDLQLTVRIRGRKSLTSPLDEKEAPFLEALSPAEVLKTTKEALIQDIIARYRSYMIEARTSPA